MARRRQKKLCERKREAGLRNLHPRFLPRRFRRGVTRAYMRRTIISRISSNREKIQTLSPQKDTVFLYNTDL